MNGSVSQKILQDMKMESKYHMNECGYIDVKNVDVGIKLQQTKS